MQKNILAAAVSAAMLLVAGSATAQLTITNEYLEENGSSLLVGHDGVTIETDQSFGSVLDALESATGLDGYIDALGTGNTLQLPIGGEAFIDQGLKSLILLGSLEQSDIQGILLRLNQAFDGFTVDSTKELNSNVVNTVGTDGKEPLLIGMNAGDLLVNGSYGSLELDRNGSVQSVFGSGNSFGVIGGSTAVNLNIKAKGAASNSILTATETKVTLGAVDIDIAGYANVGGLSAAGAALALGGKAASEVTGGVTIDITTNVHEDHKTSGAVVGVIAGGVAASTFGGEASTAVGGTTTVTATNGVNVGIFGGGAALNTELNGVLPTLLGPDGTKLQETLQGMLDPTRFASGGSATAESGNVEMTFAGDSVSVGVAGGGLGVAWSGSQGTSSNVYVETGNVDIKLGGNFNEANKEDLHTTATTVMDALGAALENPSKKDGILGALSTVTDAIAQSQEEFRGAHVGTIGGSILVANKSNAGADKAVAIGKAGEVTINISGGYNVATLGGGMTIAMGVDKVSKTSYAESNVTSSKILISGGDNVLTMSGGFAYATGENGIGSEMTSTSKVGSGTIEMSNGTADGLFGGGLAIDDTAADQSNAIATTDSVQLTISGGTVNMANMSKLLEIGSEGSRGGTPSNRSYIYDTADLVQTAEIAIVGGGIATGAGAVADSETVTIDLNGGTIVGTVLGGGLATLGGESKVGTVKINVAGADVQGDIYAGGAAGSSRNQKFDASYQDATADVTDAAITLRSGSVTGNLFAGGYVAQVAEEDGTTQATASVKNSTITITSTDVFKGARIDGNGAGSVVGTEDDHGTASLILMGGDFNMLREGAEGAPDEKTVIAAFDTVDVTGSLTGVEYEFGDKSGTIFTGGPSQLVFAKETLAGKTAQIGSADKAGFIGSRELVNGLGYEVVNGALGFGSDTVAKMAADAYGEAGAKAALYLTGKVDLTGLTIHVGEAADNVVKIGADGILIADASGSTEVTGEVTLSEKGVFFDNVGVNLGEAAETQTVTFNTALGDAAFAWDNVLWTAETTDGGKTYTFRAENVIGADPELYSFYNDLGADDPLRELISSSNYSGEESLRAGMNLAAAAGVQAAAVEGVNQGIDAATRRASLQRIYKDGVEGFAEVTGIYSKMGGSGDMNEIKLEMGGLVAGADYTTGDWTFGGLVNAGTGTVRGQGDNGGVKNEVDYYGFELYGAKRFGDFNLVGQMGYLATTNDLSDGNLGAEVDDLDADVWTVGVRGEMKYALSAKCFVVPYVGINYLRVGTDGYTTNQGTKVDSADQNLFTMPIGAAFQGTIASSSGWNWTPSVDVAYVGSFGDRDVDVDTTSVSGTVGAVSMDVWSESVFRARVGLEASKDNFGVGFVAGGSFGSDDASGFFGQIRARYAF